MSNLTLDQMPDGVLLEIFRRCRGRDLSALGLTCVTFYDALSTDAVWKELCQRELRQKSVDLGSVTTYRKLYTNLLHKYVSLLGVYQTECGHYGNLLEVKYDGGKITGTSMEGTSEPGRIFEDLVEEIQFSIQGDAEPAELVCLPTLEPHPFVIDIDETTGELAYQCCSPKQHISSLFKKLAADVQTEKFSPFTSEGTKKFRLTHLKKHMLNDSNPLSSIFRKQGKPLVSFPLILPSPCDVPASLRKEDGSIPSQIITPGVFKGDYSTHGVEILVFKYVSDNELHGFKVTGDSNIPAGKISIKCFLDYPVNPTLEEQSSLECLQDLPKTKRTVPIHELPEQRFKLPEDLPADDFSTASHSPQTCLGRYQGECQIAYNNYQTSRFIPAQIVVFSDDLIAAMILGLRKVSLFSRVQRPFQQGTRLEVESVF